MHFSSEHRLVTKKPRHKQVLGKRGEAFAARYLRERGLEIIAANVSYRVGEIDLIAREADGTIVFVEVKTRANSRYGVAEAVTPQKLGRLRKAAAQWLDGKPLSEARFDVIALVARGQGFALEHFKGVEDGSR
ncbi:YraN family protein [Corynebacterium marquesiae]|uniref:YraN family protein n=1 Tax=Corynebacterium marquesiae TaxID=2913503 RepID=UPI0030C99049